MKNSKSMEARTKCIVAQFIECYKNNPTLWDTNAADYQDKDKKKRSYEELLKVYRKLKSDATVLDVKKKINTLRSSYRREFRKVHISEQAEEASKGSTNSGVYQPNVWWFELMHFIGATMDQQYHANSTKDLIDDDDISNASSNIRSYKKMQKREMGQTDDDFDFIEYHQEDEEEEKRDNKDCHEVEKSYQLWKKGKLREKKPTPKADAPTKEDIYEHIAKTWANKLRSLTNKTQRLLAERAINEIMFQAEMGLLQVGVIQNQNEALAATPNGNEHLNMDSNKVATKSSKLRSFFEN